MIKESIDLRCSYFKTQRSPWEATKDFICLICLKYLFVQKIFLSFSKRAFMPKIGKCHEGFITFPVSKIRQSCHPAKTPEGSNKREKSPFCAHSLSLELPSCQVDEKQMLFSLRNTCLALTDQNCDLWI